MSFSSLPTKSTGSSILGLSITGETLQARTVHLNEEEIYCSNYVSTRKYSVMTFLPLFLADQFQHCSNIFFLMISLLQQIPDVSPTGRYTTIVPLLFILTVSAFKEIFEDIKRHRADRHENETEAPVYNEHSQTWAMKQWQDIEVGDLVKVSIDGYFPADLLLISSSEPNGVCYVETANLDGENNLKIRRSLTISAECKTGQEVFGRLAGASIICDEPSKRVEEFTGSLKIDDDVHPLTANQILLRGAKLKNTAWVFGLVLYTGHETKLMLNRQPCRVRRARINHTIDRELIYLFIALIIISIVCTTCNILNDISRDPNVWYLSGRENESQYHLVFVTFFILHTHLIPISLQVSLEVVRFFQANFIDCDLNMYDPSTDTRSVAKNSNLNEELGQVRYIFSDKTGTLTQNEMIFKEVSVACQIIQISDTINLQEYLTRGDESSIIFEEFFTTLSVCHTVLPDPKCMGHFESSSPDETALVRGASQVGFKFTKRTQEHVHIEVFDVKKIFKILNILDFTSDRKRMSIIVKCADGLIKLYCKGADTIIYERLRKPQNEEILSTTFKHLNYFATKGLRTLCVAYAILDQEFYHDWKMRYQTALTSIDSDPEELNEILDEIETNLTLLGATAIEDRLQDGVPEAIKLFRNAGIRIWILTGDKRETAINIGRSCNLISEENRLVVFNEESSNAARERLNGLQIDSNDVLVINGRSLKYVLSKNMKDTFVEAAMKASAVICCRVSPLQKAETVSMIQNKTEKVCLAIGDGANDVAMIQMANVGVGISGKEGLQAAHSADYSIPQFRFLVRLIFYHGATSLYRVSRLVCYSFYKNCVFSTIELWFAMRSAWSGQTLFENWSISLFNVWFTSLPPLALGLFDQYYFQSRIVNEKNFFISISDSLLSMRTFVNWIVCSIWHSFILFFVTFGIICNDNLWHSGLSDGGILVFGNFLYTYLVITVSFKAMLECTVIVNFTIFATLASVALWILYLSVDGKLYYFLPFGSEMFGQEIMAFSTATFWLGMFLVPVTALIPDILYRIYRREKHSY